MPNGNKKEQEQQGTGPGRTEKDSGRPLEADVGIDPILEGDLNPFGIGHGETGTPDFENAGEAAEAWKRD